MTKPTKWQVAEAEAVDDFVGRSHILRYLGWDVQHLVEVDRQLKLDHDKFVESGEHGMRGMELDAWRSDLRCALKMLDDEAGRLRSIISATKALLAD